MASPLFNVSVFMLVCGLLMISYTIGSSHGQLPREVRYRYLPRDLNDLGDDPDAKKALERALTRSAAVS